MRGGVQSAAGAPAASSVPAATSGSPDCVDAEPDWATAPAGDPRMTAAPTTSAGPMAKRPRCTKSVLMRCLVS